MGPLDDRRNRAAPGGARMRPVPSLLIAVAAIAALHLLLPIGPLQAIQARGPATDDHADHRNPPSPDVLALGYGAVLGMTGAALQALFANPLASPDITGSSSGAALGAVVGGYWLGITSPLALAALRGGRAHSALVALMVALAGRRAETATLLLAGLAIALAAGAGDKPAACARALALRFLRQLRLADGQLRRPQPAPSRRGADPGGDRRAPPWPAAANALDLMALGEDVAASLGYAPRRLAAPGHRPERGRRRRLRVGVRRDRVRRADRAVRRAAA